MALSWAFGLKSWAAASRGPISKGGLTLVALPGPLVSRHPALPEKQHGGEETPLAWD